MKTILEKMFLEGADIAKLQLCLSQWKTPLI
jgi:hypothetical protein